MSVAVSEITTAAHGHRAAQPPHAPDSIYLDFGADTVPRVRSRHRGGRRALDSAERRTTGVRRPCGYRPRAAVVACGRAPVHIPAPRHTRGPSPQERVEQAQVDLAVVALSAVLSALVVVCLIGLAHWRAGTFDRDTPVTVPVAVEGPLVPGGVGAGAPR